MPVALLLVVAAAILLPLDAGAETFRLVDPDGTVHYTNAPADPRYSRLGIGIPAAPPLPALRPTRGVPTLPATSAFAQHIRDAAERYGVPERLVAAVIRVESGFNARAVSPKGARGLMQLMPATASMLGVRDSFDPFENIEGGVRHLRGLIERFNNNLPFALAAYNAGEQAVQQHRGIPPYPETQDYVARILRMVDGTELAFAPAPTLTASAAPPPAVPPAPLQKTYTIVTDDGTTVYTNIPPRGRR